jgi:hypothetical protein
MEIRYQKNVGICPAKLLLLALSATRFSIAVHAVDVNCPVNMLLEMLSTCRGWPGVKMATRAALH